MRTLAIGVILLMATAASAQGTALIPAEEAGEHVDETVTVKGVVTHVRVLNDGTVLLDFGPYYPSQVFSAVIRKADWTTFPDATKLTGKTVLVSGTIIRSNGTPQILLTKFLQLQVVPSP